MDRKENKTGDTASSLIDQTGSVYEILVIGKYKFTLLHSNLQ